MTDERESKIERDICNYAEQRGWLQFKTVTPGKKGFPDRLFLRKGMYVHIEVKKYGETPNPQQDLRHRELRQAGAKVHWVDTFEKAVAILR